MDLVRILQDPALPEQLPEADLAEAIGALESLKAKLFARLIGNPRGDKTPALAEPDTLLTAKQAAPLLNVTPHWLYRHARQLLFTRRLSRKVLRFSESGLRRWQAIKRA